ncbi:aldehyde dehydrogenase (NADP(+)) [Nocardia carnea]|uniref:aldehyde dehydrogenase (NADP(+)) n=1 Tax=Nocardia carnea TaxID=37328 RepID=UPI002458DA85|nr:aldehyde dehydrogenase (NADP(+)) [Nocardia carnea]
MTAVSDVLLSVDPRTGTAESAGVTATSSETVAEACEAACAAYPVLMAAGRTSRAGLLEEIATRLEARGERIVAAADRETALGAVRLRGELVRTCYQLRMFAQVIVEGSYLEAVIDHAGENPVGATPDLRSLLVPIGPVAVFGASNFPLAFSVPGGDTAAALAAGCPVVVKAHSSHLRTSALCAQAISEAVAARGLPAGVFGVVYGQQAGIDLVTHPDITAVAFTGGHGGGAALRAAIATRSDPIPFYGELGSVNPLIVTPAAAADRPEALGAGLVESATLGGGQFCTKPGLALIPGGADGDAVLDAIDSALTVRAPQVLLNEGIARTYADRAPVLSTAGADTITGRTTAQDEPGFAAAARAIVVDAADLTDILLEECFGPLFVVVRYRDDAELHGVLTRLPGSLAAAIHGGAGADPVRDAAAAVLGQRSGRVLFDGYPTGVAVSWAQHHGGPWPATNTQFTSVGATSIRRFLRPLAFQSAPEQLLPEELRDGPAGVPRRVDGRLVLPDDY